MGKAKYDDFVKNWSIELRLEGKSIPEITEKTGMKKEALNKLFQRNGIKLTEKQAAIARARRWLGHEPTTDGKKICSRCGENKPLGEFHNDSKTLSGVTYACKKCYSDYYEANSEEIKARTKNYKLENPDLVKQWDKNRYEAKKDEYIENAAQWAENNPERKREIERKYDKANQPQKNARTALYRARKIQATPKWLSQHQLDEIRRMYENCPKGFQVDHIIPLRGENVRGLHVPWNLQYLPALENNRKGNRI